MITPDNLSLVLSIIALAGVVVSIVTFLFKSGWKSGDFVSSVAALQKTQEGMQQTQKEHQNSQSELLKELDSLKSRWAQFESEYKMYTDQQLNRRMSDFSSGMDQKLNQLIKEGQERADKFHNLELQVTKDLSSLKVTVTQLADMKQQIAELARIQQSTMNEVANGQAKLLRVVMSQNNKN